ncbi:hypothetical protein Zmor_008441 [Zophobas morio]|uniref:Uncharacterized protein n=1 Tax=Zophobas morio TaxID=2755281 RepID=A0AA38IV19_9CUCU|nr:hypothetical protein Zmor_008441 [Zophobas morio]
MPHDKQVGVRGRIVNSQSREVIANVLRFMKKEATKGAPVIPISNYKQRLIEATGISDRVYRQVVKDMELIEAGKLSTFTAPIRAPRPKFIIIDNGEHSGDVETEDSEVV